MNVSDWVDPDDAPELTAEFFESAEIREGDKVIRPATGTLTRMGRPLVGDAPKKQVTLRIDPDIIKHIAADDATKYAAIASQGRFHLMVDAKLIGPNGELLPHDGQSAGDLYVRGPWVISRYYADPAADATYGVLDSINRGDYIPCKHG